MPMVQWLSTWHAVGSPMSTRSASAVRLHRSWPARVGLPPTMCPFTLGRRANYEMVYGGAFDPCRFKIRESLEGWLCLVECNGKSISINWEGLRCNILKVNALCMQVE
ncbi:hypothetical protein CRG98_019248 [Punica granatum]|uniref:Uncharacterized protein n=1 Tax=Punica granatum TaxID=22663 RepID=A0A2I0JVN3_PUNGR|nr:hypothetical protein CRG98_019248 [Punica granatum]